MQEPPLYGRAEDHRALLPGAYALHLDYLLRSMQQVMRELLTQARNLRAGGPVTDFLRIIFSSR